jgi:hypothetical protein
MSASAVLTHPRTSSRRPSGDAGAPVGTARRVLASASLAASAAGIGSLALEGGQLSSPAVLVVAGVVGTAAVGLARRSLLHQVLSRGVAWVVLTPTLFGLAESISRQRLPDAHVLFFGATSAAALLLARPALHTAAARAEFSPVGYRRIFLAGAVASIMMASVLAFFALQILLRGAFFYGLTALALALMASTAALVAAAVGVLRMRAWGVLLGGLTSVVALGGAFFTGDVFVAPALVLLAIPGLVLASPLLLARLLPPVPDPSARNSGHREVTLEEYADAEPAVRARVAGVAEPEPEGQAIAEAGNLAVAGK